MAGPTLRLSLISPGNPYNWSSEPLSGVSFGGAFFPIPEEQSRRQKIYPGGERSLTILSLPFFFFGDHLLLTRAVLCPQPLFFLSFLRPKTLDVDTLLHNHQLLFCLGCGTTICQASSSFSFPGTVPAAFSPFQLYLLTSSRYLCYIGWAAVHTDLMRFLEEGHSDIRRNLTPFPPGYNLPIFLWISSKNERVLKRNSWTRGSLLSLLHSFAGAILTSHGFHFYTRQSLVFGSIATSVL